MSGRRRRAGPRDPVLVFVHVPKTAGATLHRIIERELPGRNVATLRVLDEPPGSIAEHLRRAGGETVDVVKGHVYYGVHEHLRRPVQYVTMLRHPVDRVVSLYRFVCTEPRHPLHRQVRDMSLEQFVASGLDADQVSNGQTRQVVGAPGRALDADDLELAWRRLSERFAAVGLQERFDESLVLFRRALGWRRPPVYLRRNVTGGPRPHLTAEARTAVAEHNPLDLELYERTRELVHRRERTTPGFRLELAALRGLLRVAAVAARSRP